MHYDERMSRTFIQNMTMPEQFRFVGSLDGPEQITGFVVEIRIHDRYRQDDRGRPCITRVQMRFRGDLGGQLRAGAFMALWADWPRGSALEYPDDGGNYPVMIKPAGNYSPRYGHPEQPDYFMVLARNA